jgi:hypothetical protein
LCTTTTEQSLYSIQDSSNLQLNTNRIHFYGETMIAFAVLSFFPTSTAQGQKPQENKSSLDPTQLA